jgi:hypothetical protein
MNEPDLADKLTRLEETADHAERHTLALELSGVRDQRVFEVLVRLIQRPQLENRRGTLIYCLEGFDCSSAASVLKSIAETGNFEAAMQADMILEEQRLR